NVTALANPWVSERFGNDLRSNPAGVAHGHGKTCFHPLQPQRHIGLLPHLVEQLPDRALVRELGANLITNLGLIVLTGIGRGDYLQHSKLWLPAWVGELERSGNVTRFRSRQRGRIRWWQRVARE